VQLEINVAFDNDIAPTISNIACNVLHTIAVTSRELEDVVKGALSFCSGALRALETQETTIAIYKNDTILKKGDVIAEKLE
jgi:hypothetical protein